MLEVRTSRPRIVQSETARTKDATRRLTAVILVGGLLGVGCAIGGISISLLTLFGVLTRNRTTGGVSLALIVLALTSLFGATHGMDKVREIEKREKHKKLMQSFSTLSHHEDKK
ncbi:MAG TPA: hypothetical protein DEA22_12815 [Blastocatellia bacterium]|nr:hypothetical protein [Blastocatellia bacterium]